MLTPPLTLPLNHWRFIQTIRLQKNAMYLQIMDKNVLKKASDTLSF